MALRADREVALAAMTQAGDALMWTSAALLHDHEFMLAAVAQDGDFALRFASEALRNDREVVLAAVAQDGCALRLASAALWKDALLCRLAGLATRGQRRWHLLRVKFRLRSGLAWWCALAAEDEAHFAVDGTAVMAGRGARAAKRAFDDMMEPMCE